MAEEQDTERGLIGIKNDEEEEKEPSEERKEKPGTRTKGNQRWMKLRTTVQLSGAISHTIQKSKPPLKREDSFLKRFSTRQIPELEETVDTGEEAGYSGESSSSGIARLYYKKQRRKRKQPSSVYTVVNPDGNLYFYWLLVVSVGVLYNLWTLIVRQAFPELQDDHERFWGWADVLTDIVFLLDVGVQLRTGYLEQGLMVYDSKKLAGHYVKSRKFLLDLLALFPLELAQFNLGVKPMLRFPRFLKLYRVYTYYYIVESRTVYPNVWRVVNLIHILLILAHWFGCFYFLLSEAEGFQGDWVYPYRPGEYATLARKYLGSLYWSTLTLTTIGDLPTPETNADKGKTGRTQLMRGHKSRLLKFSSNLGYIFTIVSYLIGVFIFATIVDMVHTYVQENLAKLLLHSSKKSIYSISGSGARFPSETGQVGNVITNRNANRLEFERLLDGAKTYMRHHKVPGGMKRRVLRWYDYSWSRFEHNSSPISIPPLMYAESNFLKVPYEDGRHRGRIQGGGDINTALGLLPDKLKTELALHVNLSVLKKVTIFQECQPEFLHDLVLKMKAYIFTPGDMICRKGEVAREMFIIADGILEVMSETGRVLTTMKAGDFFGEIGILNLDGLNKRTADVRSVGYSELFSLSREDVLTAMKDYPEAQEILQTLGRKRLMEARNLNRAWKMSAQQKKEGKTAAQNPPKPEKTEAEENGNKGSIVDKLKGDVMELRNVFKKSSKTIRGKSECVEIEMSKCHIEREKENNLGARAPLARASCAYDGDTSHDEEAAPKPLGAGLPLMQRLKLLKEKEESQRKSSEEGSTASAPPCVERKELDPALPLLQRILQIKQKDEKKSEVVVQNTANMAAEVLATTVRTQLKSPTTLTLKPTLKAENAVQNSVQENKASLEIQKKIMFKEDKKMSIDISGPTTNEGVKKEMEKRNTSECDNESWILIKKAILIPNNSLDIPEKKSSDNKKSEEAPIQQLNYLKEKTLSVINSMTDTSGENSLNQQLEETRNDISDNLQRLFLRSTDDKNRKHKDLAVHSDDESCHRTFPMQPSPRIYKRRKIYHSIDDLSPEYSGLPFVKKLKILNERQKLAELEKSEKDDKILEPCCSHKMTDPLTSQVQSDESRPRKPSENNNELSLVISEGTLNEVKSTPSNNLNEGGISPSKINESLQAVLKDTEVPLLSPESNETLERRKLKSILKKLTSVSTNNSVTGAAAEGTFHEKKSTAEIRKLLRAPTVEGYAARHSKFTKSMTLHHNTVEDISSLADSLTDSISNFDENDHNAHSWDNSAGRTKFSTWTDSSRSLDDSQLTEISTFENSALPPLQSEKCVESTVTEVHQSVDEIQKWEYFSSEYEDSQIKVKDTEDEMLPDESRTIGVNCFPKELLSHLFFEIRKVIDDHMDRIENNYVQKYAKLEHEYKKKEETVLELQKKIQELENKVVPEPEIPEEDEEEESQEENDEDSDIEVSHCGIRVPLHPMPMSELSSARMDSDDSSSSDEDTNVFHNDWEIHLLAEEMEKQEASRERAVSFDFSQLERKREAESTERRRARWSSASEPPPVRRTATRSMSTNNIPRYPRRTHVSYNGTYSSITSTSQLKKPASFNDFS